MTPTAGWVSLIGGTLSAVIVWLLSLVGVINLPGQGTAFVAAATGFVVDLILAVLVSLGTKPKPAEELVGFVYSETPKSNFHDPALKTMPVLARPVPLACIALAMVIVLNVLF
ncbi:hypothetical protein [Actinobaculum sp. 313]|nr:hypothetical protein [Actinobaculum sp. 313]